jgi:hypothetical protein
MAARTDQPDQSAIQPQLFVNLSVAPRTPSSVEKDAQQLAAQIGYEQVRFY